MVEYAVLDAGMGGLVIILGGVAAVVFVVMAVIILRFSIRAIKSELKKEAEAEQLDAQQAKEEDIKAEQKDEEV
ncbi:MAG: hypothetical protein IK018_07040 [Lachnospiraceae bacterium]|nr:hypothetical protein [Lachnospiraceae bacterium]MBR5993544.1 hypothetical protein [Lachnospiraceae bacterium]